MIYPNDVTCEKTTLDNINNYDYQITSCPIHRSICVDEYLRSINLPQHLHTTLHCLLLVRGLYPKEISDWEVRQLVIKARDIMHSHEVSPIDSALLFQSYVSLVGQWITNESNHNR